MKRTIQKSTIAGEIVVPSSKSALQRIIAASFLVDGKSIIKYNTISEDSKAAIKLIETLGSKVSIKESEIVINRNSKSNASELLIGESGLGLRMFSPILALNNKTLKISGSGSLLKRPVAFIVDTLRNFGIDIKSTNGKLPLFIQGPYKIYRAKIDGAFSSQLLTGLLMALPLCESDSELEVSNLKSKPYIDLTLHILKQYDIKVSHKNYELFKIKGNQKYKPVVITTEGDWSAAAFLAVAGAIAGSLKITDLDLNSNQGDKEIINVIEMVGAIVIRGNNFVKITKNILNSFKYDATDTPDLFPPLVALAVHCNGKSVIEGVNRLIHKESNRALALKVEFEKLGAKVSIEDNKMIIEGSIITGNHVSSHHDHRIAMALAITAFRANGKMIIDNSEAVGKSWPLFFEDITKIGAKVEKN